MPQKPPEESGSTLLLRKPQVSVNGEKLLVEENGKISQLDLRTAIFSPHFQNCCFSNPPLSSLDNTYLCLAVMDSVLCVIFLHGRSSPQTSPSATPCLMKSLSFEAQPKELEEQPLSPMHYARSGLGTAALNGRLIAAGQNMSMCWSVDEDIDGEHGGELGASAACRRLQQRGVSENCGELPPQGGPLELHSTHEDSAGSIPDGRSYGKALILPETLLKEIDGSA